MKRLLLRALAFSACLALVRAGDIPPPPAPELIQRADKIIAPLQLSDAAQADRVREIIARHYEQLRLIHQLRDQGFKLAKEVPDKSAADTRRAEVAAQTDQHLAALHTKYLATLALVLTPEQIEIVKDGMTYNVAPNTFRVYLQMLPELTAEQKAQIHAWLLEAREHAMDGSTAEEKHAWFGKYKGKINNYLTKAGYNMKDAEKNLKK